MFVGNARSLPRVEHLKGAYLVDPTVLTHKHKTRLEELSTNIRKLRPQKVFMTLGHGKTCTVKLYTLYTKFQNLQGTLYFISAHLPNQHKQWNMVHTFIKK